MQRFKLLLTNRFILLVFGGLLFVVVNLVYTGKVLPSTSTKDIWFYSGLSMLLFSVLFIEPYYSSPKNVISNTIPLILVYLSVMDSFANMSIWWSSIGLMLALLMLSILAMVVVKPEESEDSGRNKAAKLLMNIAVLLGNGKVIYSLVFLSVLYLYRNEILQDIAESYLFVMIVLWGGILIIDPKSLHNRFVSNQGSDADSIGEIFSVQSNNMFLIKLYADKSAVLKFDIVKFRFSFDENSTVLNAGIVFSTYKLNHEKWAKVLVLGSASDGNNCKPNKLYKIVGANKTELLQSLKIDSFVGVVIEGSRIGSVKFEYSQLKNDLQEGDLLELKIGDKRIFYQVIEGTTDFEKLELKNEGGLIEGEALQLGTWNGASLSFEKYGWVPEINTPIFKASTQGLEVPDVDLPDFKLGVIPNTQLPSVINLDEAVSHHTALLGITGAGKSYLAKLLIDAIKVNTKVICVDFTGEWKKKMNLVPVTSQNLEQFLTTEHSDVGVVEIPVVSNTVEVIQSTESFISAVFSLAKAAYDANAPMKICLVLEEAHTIIPEGNFLGVNDFNSKAVVNKMGQVALQGRKYGVGLMVLAQRTANVSKTVLTQCNTIICFQAFDETSFTFLGNYIGKDLVQTLPNLNKFHAIVTGKAIRSKIPMIVNLERQQEGQ